MPAFLRINPADNVAVALEPLAAGTVLSLPEGNVAAVEEIPAGHKIALCDIAEGENIIKYGESIGLASADIACATLANDSNIVSQPRRYADEYILGKEAAK